LAALATYLRFSRHATESIPDGEFGVEFVLDDGLCRPDKDIVKRGLRMDFLEPVEDNGKLGRFRLAEKARRDLVLLGFVEAR
jgi:hypothetical protein